MSRAAVLLSALVLLAISVVPLGRTVAESFLVRDPQGHVVEVTGRRYAELFAGAGDAPSAGGDASGAPANETPANRPAWKRWTMLGNSAAIALVGALLAVAIGVPFALLVTRTDLPFRRLLGGLSVVPLVLPPLLVGVAWTYLPFAAPPPVTSAPEPSAWDGLLAILRAGGMFALCYFPLVVLFTSRAVRRVPAPLEEAARLAGGTRRTLLRVTLPLAAPTILASALFVFLFALEDFALVDFLNWVRPVGQRVGVYPYESFTAWTKSQGEGIATALGVPLVVLGIALLVVIHRLVVRDARTAVAGDYREAAPWRLGPWRWPAAAAALAVVGVAAVLPIAGLVWKSGQGGLDAYRRVWALVAGPQSSTQELLWTLWLAAAAAAVALPIAYVLAHHSARSGRIWPLVLAFLPLAVPPVFLGAGSLRVYQSEWLSIPLPGGGSRNPFIDPDSPHLGAVLVLVAKYVPFAVAALWASFLGIDPRLEEAAASAGARPLDRAVRIVAPLARPALAAAFVLVFVFSLREIDTLVLLESDTLLRRVYTMVHFQRDEQVAALCVLLLLLQALPFAFLALLLPRAVAEKEERSA
jgi:iron(III) transport system permease protein